MHIHSSTSGAPHSHHCLIDSTTPNPKEMPLFTRLRDTYMNAIKSFSHSLFRSGWIISHYLVASCLGEPLASSASGFRRIYGWESTWDKHGFYDAGNAASLKKLEIALKAELIAAKKLSRGTYRPPLPVILFHGVHSTPDIWLPWADELEKARNEGQIGHVITLQLPNEMEERMVVVHQAIKDVTEIYMKVFGIVTQVNLLGHSKGGFAAHLAAYKNVTVYDENHVERRWHGTEQRNPLVNKVVSIAGPTWLCCQNQKDAFDPTNKDIYPKDKFSPEQLAIIKKNHADIYDIVPEEDAISPTYSPLPTKQVKVVKHGHLGVMDCPSVCLLAIELLSKNEG